MGSVNPDHKKTSNLYPEVIVSSPDAAPTRSSSSSSSSSLPPSSNLYPTIDMRDLAENLFPEPYDRHPHTPSAPPEAVEEVLIRVPGAILNLIDRNYSVELACGDFSIVRLRQGDKVVAVLARVDDEIQWPLAKDEAAVKLDDSHYFFSLQLPEEHHSDSDSSDDETEHGKKKKKKKNKNKNKNKKNKKEPEMLNYGLTIASKGQEPLLKQLDEVLKACSCFSVQKVSEHAKGEVVDETVAKEISPAELESGGTKEMMEGKCVAYWTTLAPNVEDYSGTAAKLIAMGSGQLIKGILWCGDVTIDRLKKGNEVMKNRMSPRAAAEVSPETLKRIKRVKRITRMTERVATGVLSGVVKVTGLFTSKVANSRVGKKFFGLLPGEVVLASLDGFSKLCDAAEVAGKNVMSTSSTVTTELVSHRYGEKAAEATSEGLDAAGHAIGTAWAGFKIRKAFNPKSVLKPTSLAKSAAKAAAAEIKAKKSK